MKHVKLFEQFINEGLSSYEYDKFIKEHGKIKWPSWIKKTRKEIIKAGMMDKVYDADHHNMSIWINSLGQDFFSINADSKKREKEFGKVGSKFIQRFYHDIMGYNGIFWESAYIALQISKNIEDRVANDEPVEPAYYMAKEYFNNFGLETNRSRTFDSTVKKLSAWMNDPRNKIKTL